MKDDVANIEKGVQRNNMELKERVEVNGRYAYLDCKGKVCDNRLYFYHQY